MLDIRLIREDPETVRQALANRQEDTAIVDEILALDTTRRERILELEELRHSRKQLARDRAAAEQGRALRDQVHNLENTVRDLEQELEGLLLQVPNVPHSSVPIGAGDDDNPIVRTWGESRTFDFTPAPHWTLGESLRIIDFERGVKLSGSRFYVLKGLGARLQRALIAFMLALHTDEHGYQEIYPPWMVKRESAAASGHLPKFADTMYHDEQDDLWFVPTAEVPLTNLHRDEIIAPGMLPFDYVAYTACFRREKMSAGKDTRGIKRGHQFDKVEMYKFTEPESSYDQLEKMIADAEEVCRRLELPYRIRELCTGDLGFAAAKSYDMDVWAPGCEEWLEVSSCSNCTDFQGRRGNIRYRPTPDARPQFVHTLNGSGVALPRIMIAVIENYQRSDGSIAVPEVLRGFVGTDVITA